jgi:hypothetical protein
MPTPFDTATNFNVQLDECTLHYCWTHQRKAEGHQHAASASNMMMGGSNVVLQSGNHGATRTNTGN